MKIRLKPYIAKKIQDAGGEWTEVWSNARNQVQGYNESFLGVLEVEEGSVAYRIVNGPAKGYRVDFDHVDTELGFTLPQDMFEFD